MNFLRKFIFNNLPIYEGDKYKEIFIKKIIQTLIK